MTSNAFSRSTDVVKEKTPVSFSSSRNWLVIYTRPRWEKKVNSLLQAKGIESYCPLRKVIHQWADRKKIVEMPLFSSYVFVKVNAKEQHQVRQVLGVLNFVYYMGRPAKVRDADIDRLKDTIKICPDLEVLDLNTFSVGDVVAIKNGVLNSKTGIVVKVQGKSVLMVLDTLDCALVSRVNIENLTLIN